MELQRLPLLLHPLLLHLQRLLLLLHLQHHLLVLDLQRLPLLLHHQHILVILHQQLQADPQQHFQSHFDQAYLQPLLVVQH